MLLFYLEHGWSGDGGAGLVIYVMASRIVNGDGNICVSSGGPNA